MERSASPPPLLDMAGIQKSFPGVRALKGVDLQLARGEVLGLIGENGAGKSTLMKVLGGAHQPDAGSVKLDGAVVDLQSPNRARVAGIGVIYQEFHLVPELSVTENVFLGCEISRAAVIDRAAEWLRGERSRGPAAPQWTKSMSRNRRFEEARCSGSDTPWAVGPAN